MDVAFYHFTLHREDIPVPLMKRLIEQHAKDPALLTYIMIGYGHDFFYRKEFQPGEIADAAAIYVRFVDVLSGLLNIKSAKLGAFDTALIIDTRSRALDLLRSQSAFREARTKLSRVIVQAMIDGRFRDGANGDYCMLPPRNCLHQHQCPRPHE